MYSVVRPRFKAVAGMLFAACIAVMGASAPSASAEVVRAVEYFHKDFEHYFVTANPQEIALLDGGVFKGWWRTGQRYRVDDSPAPDLVPVCRFFTAEYAGKASHFYTASAAECEHVKTMPDWTYEGISFHVRLPDASGICGPGTTAINRLFNGGQGGAPNHAYTSDPGKRDLLIKSGWISEGVVFCAPLAPGDSLLKTQELAGSYWTFTAGPPTEYSASRYLMHAQFANVAFTEPAPTYFGVPVRPAAINSGGSVFVNYGTAAWDAVAGSYLYETSVQEACFDEDSWEPCFPIYVGTAMLFDDARGPTTPICYMTVMGNLISLEPPVLHPFQPYLWPGCTPGVATKS
jgi:Repeat of unknown function (DUF5648)